MKDCLMGENDVGGLRIDFQGAFVKKIGLYDARSNNTVAEWLVSTWKLLGFFVAVYFFCGGA